MGRSPDTRSERSFAVAAATLCVVAFSVILASPAQATPPAGRTYFTIVLGLEGPTSYQAVCLTFTATEVCTSGGHCGTWTPIQGAGPADAIELQMRFNVRGVAVRIDGRGQLESRGDRRHSLAGTARAKIAEDVVNFGFAGRPESAETCAHNLRKWNEKNDVLRY